MGRVPRGVTNFQQVNAPLGGYPIRQSSPFDVVGGIQGGVTGSQNGPTGNVWLDAGLGALGGLFGGGDEAPGDALVPGGGGGPCPDGTFSVLGKCIDLIPGGATQGGGMVMSGGAPVLGIHGVAMVPQARTQTVRRCLPGMVLGSDGLCYNKSQIRRNERAHPPGRKPLMTGGDLNAISRASRVAKALERKTKQLQAMGMIKKPPVRYRKK